MFEINTNNSLGLVPLSSSSIDNLSLREHYQSRFMHLLDISQDGFFHIDKHGVMLVYNTEFYTQFGIEENVISLQRWQALIHPADRAKADVTTNVAAMVPSQKRVSQFRLQTPKGTFLWLECHMVCFCEKGEKYLIGYHHNISSKKKMENFVTQSSCYDHTTGLYNLNKLIIDLNNLKRRVIPTPSLLYIKTELNLSHEYLYKYKNKIHNTIIESIQVAYGQFHHSIRALYRLTEGDYAILLQTRDSETQPDITAAVRDMIAQFPQRLANMDIPVSGALGVGIYPNCDLAKSSDEIINIAHQTCCYAMDKTGQSLEVYAGETEYQVARYFYIENALREAIEQNRLSVRFHPIMSASGHHITSFEALVRWHSATYGSIRPDEFIPIAEKKGLIVELGYLVMRKACAFLQAYHQKYRNNIRINVNVSILQLLHADFAAGVQAIIRDCQLSPSNIVLELTETFILDNNELAIQQLNRLKSMGFILSLDDFGAGFSSVNSFFDFPFNQIKIDTTFAIRALKDMASSKYLEFLIQLCKEKAITTVIEGIETGEMLDKFSSMGADYLQGYWFSKPMSTASALSFSPQPA